jgi:Fuc2NAc and GlcNAc transferase
VTVGWRIVVIVAGALLAFLLTAVIRRHAEGLGLIDVPNARSSHTHPVPRGGGIALAIVILCGLTVFALSINTHSDLFTLIAGGALVAIVGLADDRRSQPVVLRVLVHLAAAGLAVATLGPVRLVTVPGLFELPLGWTAAPLTVLWIVAMVNAYNFMDGIDGIAAGQAIVAGGGWIWLGAAYDLPIVELTGLLIAGAAAGFLVHNRPPARIFLGDVGSGFLGYMLAVLTVAASRERPELFLAGVLFMWAFLLDTAVTLIRRAWNRENVFAAHRSHLYQRLVINGHSHAVVAGLYTAAAVVGVAVAVVITR